MTAHFLVVLLIIPRPRLLPVVGPEEEEEKEALSSHPDDSQNLTHPLVPTTPES